LSTVVVAVVLPKCPACVAAYLVAGGVGAGVAATVAPIARPAAFVVAVALFVAWFVLRVRHRRADSVVTSGGPSDCACSIHRPNRGRGDNDATT